MRLPRMRIENFVARRSPPFVGADARALFERAAEKPWCGQLCGEVSAVFSAVARDPYAARGVQAVYHADNSGWTTLSTGVEKIVDNMTGLLPQFRKQP